MPAPVTNAGSISGSKTRQKIVQRVAPKVAPASSYSDDNSSRTGCTARTTNGKLTTTNANQIPNGVNAILNGNSLPIKPLGAYKVANATPITAVGKANGKSTTAFIKLLPTN